MLPTSLLTIVVFAIRCAALPRGDGGGQGVDRSRGGIGGYESDGGDSRVRRSLSGFHPRVVLGGPSGDSLRSALKYRFKALSYSRGTIARREGSSFAGDRWTANNDTQLPGNSIGLYSVANITIHQYPLIIDSLNETTLPTIIEDVSLWIFDLDNGNPSAATAAQCSLTWTASAASFSNSSSRQQMRCVTRGEDGRNQVIPNYTPKYNVTFEQQTESPLSGFNVFISSSVPGKSTRGSAVWAPRSLASDDTWQINEAYFQHPGFVPIGTVFVPRKRAMPAIPDDQTRSGTFFQQPTMASPAINTRRSAQDDTSVQSVVAGIINSTLANAAIHVSSARFNAPNNQIAVSELINSTLINSTLNIGSETGDSSNPAPNTVSDHERKTSAGPANNNNNTIIDAAIEAASTLFNIPKSNIKLVNVTTTNNNTTTMISSSHLQTAHIILTATVNAAVNAASKLFNLPKSQIKVVAANDNIDVTGEAPEIPSPAPKNPSDQIKVADLSNGTIAGAAVKVPPTPVP